MEDMDRPSADDVISKLKDEGDFDTLRLKIIRKLKDNEELRNRIVSKIKESTTANCEGVEKLTPRQLSDAINQELGNKIMDQISDELWKIIRSKDGMQTEIRETVESVYDRLRNPPPKDEAHVSTSIDPPPSAENNSTLHVQQPTEPSVRQPTSPCELDPDVPPGFAPAELDVPPGFAPVNQSLVSNTKLDTHLDQNGQAPPCKEVNEQQRDSVDTHPLSASGVHPLSSHLCSSEPTAFGSEDEPDVPPGFG